MAQQVLQVAPPGQGDVEAFPTVQAAIDAVPLGNPTRVVIRLAPGVYKEPVYVAKTKNFITMVGAAPEATVISWDNCAKRINHPLPSSVIGEGTFGCGTFIIEGEDFIAENITFENSSPQYLRDCYIEGHCDFIFGNSVALMEHCHIHCKAAGYITAHNRKSTSESTGYVFLRCQITGNGEAGYMFLGRPWGSFGRVVFAHTFMDQCVQPSGWHNWDKSENEQTACFYEYRCSGPGSCSSDRVAWCKQLPDDEAEQFLSHTFIDPDLDRPWLRQMMATRVPASV
ncbi:unnamed protein product [Urochloa decumbens]|uniref:pectinesterase n=1 Tax=Urochloa decumbens TaxID=240449 RepID=A0ABC9HBH1_9POAL